jgi:hypothetical protein
MLRLKNFRGLRDWHVFPRHLGIGSNSNDAAIAQFVHGEQAVVQNTKCPTGARILILKQSPAAWFPRERCRRSPQAP